MNHGLSISQRALSARVLRVKLGGELTSESACTLAKWVEQICDRHVRSIRADMRRLDCVDEAGAWTLALAFQCIRFHGNPVKIYNAPLLLHCVLEAVCIDLDGDHRAPGSAPPRGPSDRCEHESLAAVTPPRGWLAMDVLICNEDPQLSSMFAIFEQLSCGQGQPANAEFAS